MRVKMLLFLAVLFAASMLAPPGSAQQEVPGSGELQELRLQLQDVLERMDALEEGRSTEAVAAASKERPATNDDLNALRRAAADEADKETAAEDQLEETTFKSGNLGLQALNPEISVTGDMLEFMREGDDVETTSDVVFRGLGFHLEAYLDPYSRFKAAVPVDEGGAELGEAYFTRYGILPGINVTLGKFRQQFGVVNRWHKHALDWFDFPLALRMVFGPGGLNQTGLSLDWNGGIGGTVHELIVQATDGDNPRILGQNTKNRPSVLAHYKAYRDLSAGTYVEIGGTGFVGWNDAWQLSDATTISETLVSLVYGIDLTVAWEPLDRMRYRNVEWRSEVYIVDMDIQAPDGSGRDRLHPWGLYTSLQSRMTRTIDIGLRFDYYQPETRLYAAVPGLPLSQVVATDQAYRQQSAAFLTWSQSPFVKFRVGYSYASGRGTGADEHTVGLQIVFAAGPHKHERY
ncbi:MAG TPA: hypothetical protein VM118_03515 [Acidobacteriota bacterium]|nr:hypothetical protein [Acidobacteriota bacterium]